MSSVSRRPAVSIIVPRIAEQRAHSRDQAFDPLGNCVWLHKVVALVGKIDRRLEPRDQVEQQRIDFADGSSQRAFQLVEGSTRLQRRDGVNQIRNRFGLHQIDAAIQERAKREFARFRGAGAARRRLLDNRPQDDRTPVRAQLQDVFAGVRVRRRKVRGDNLIDRLGTGECGPARLELAAMRDEPPSDRTGIGPAETNHSDPATSRRCRDRDDRVGG